MRAIYFRANPDAFATFATHQGICTCSTVMASLHPMPCVQKEWLQHSRIVTELCANPSFIPACQLIEGMEQVQEHKFPRPESTVVFPFDCGRLHVVNYSAPSIITEYTVRLLVMCGTICTALPPFAFSPPGKDEKICPGVKPIPVKTKRLEHEIHIWAVLRSAKSF